MDVVLQSNDISAFSHIKKINKAPSNNFIL